MPDAPLILDYADLSLDDVPRVGGKNASCGEMLRTLRPLGIGVVDGFATTAAAYRLVLAQDGLRERLAALLEGLDPEDVADLARRGAAARQMVRETPLPDILTAAIRDAHARLCARLGRAPELAVRSSATAEDLPEASFAGQHESYLNVRGDALLDAVHECMASLFTDRALVYRQARGYDHLQVALSVGVQPMIRSDIGASGVIFTLDTESGFRDVVEITGGYGLGEYVVQGEITPDEWTVFKPTLRDDTRPIVARALGGKESKLVFGDHGDTVQAPVDPADRARFCLSDDEVLTLARWAVTIERHYSERAGADRPMDIEFARDGLDGTLYIIQARPETVHAGKRTAAIETYRLEAPAGRVLASGQAVGQRIASGRVRVVRETAHLSTVQPGEILVAEITDPDWEPVMKRVAAIVTDRGGRTAHAAIVSRELGLPCVVGTGDATTALIDGQEVTVCCAEGSVGRVTEGATPFTVERVEIDVAPTRTKVQLTVADPELAFSLAALPCAGVGLARMEFIVANHIGIHPMALAHWPDIASESGKAAIAERVGPEESPKEYFVRRLAEGIGRIAAAFYPRFVLVRTSDFKTNEYARLAGGDDFEPSEENPMLGFRGASRYYDPRYADGFALECVALKRVREEMGLDNVHVMIPFCRTVAEARKVVDAMASHGLPQGGNGLQVWGMCEIPSNVLLAERFLEVFDGFSIGSNDLTQLALGVDRDSGTVAHLYDERDDAVTWLIAHVIAAARTMGKPIGICGQAPSDYPEFAAWLVAQGVTSISLNPDTFLATARVIAQAEALANR